MGQLHGQFHAAANRAKTVHPALGSPRSASNCTGSAYICRTTNQYTGYQPAFRYPHGRTYQHHNGYPRPGSNRHTGCPSQRHFGAQPPLRKIILATLLIIFFVSGCVPPLGISIAALPSDSPTAFFLVTVPADATPTLTPFQPMSEGETPTPVPSLTNPPLPDVPSATFDPNTIQPPESTPQSFYAPPYAPKPVPVLTDAQTVTFLLLGSDKRPGQKYFRTDTIVIAAVRPGAGQVTLISVPRDLYVYIPTIGMDRVNAAYEYGQMHQYPGGGTALLKDTILYNLGIRIDHLAIVDFEGFSRIVDTLGGLDVPVFCPYTDWHLIDPGYDPNNEKKLVALHGRSGRCPHGWQPGTLVCPLPQEIQ
jgi:LCP family protein required for cell wall assembly